MGENTGVFFSLLWEYDSEGAEKFSAYRYEENKISRLLERKNESYSVTQSAPR